VLFSMLFRCRIADVDLTAGDVILPAVQEVHLVRPVIACLVAV